MCLLIISLEKSDFTLSKENNFKFLLHISKLTSKRVMPVDIPTNRILDFTEGKCHYFKRFFLKKKKMKRNLGLE